MGTIDQQARRDDQQSGPDESASGRIGIDSSKPATLFAHGRSDWREQVLLLPGHELGGNPGDVLTACLAELGLAVVVLTAIGATPRCVTHAGSPFRMFMIRAADSIGALRLTQARRNYFRVATQIVHGNEPPSQYRGSPGKSL